MIDNAELASRFWEGESVDVPGKTNNPKDIPLIVTDALVPLVSISWFCNPLPTPVGVYNLAVGITFIKISFNCMLTWCEILPIQIHIHSRISFITNYDCQSCCSKSGVDLHIIIIRLCITTTKHWLSLHLIILPFCFESVSFAIIVCIRNISGESEIGS